MKIKKLQEKTNKNLISLSKVLERDEEITFIFEKRLIYIQKSCENGFDVNFFSADEDNFEDDELNFDKAKDGAVYEVETELEAIILSLNE